MVHGRHDRLSGRARAALCLRRADAAVARRSRLFVSGVPATWVYMAERNGARRGLTAMSAERIIHIQRPRIPLALRARFAWTFFGAGLFTAITLFLLGFYLLREAIFNPLQASPAVIVSAGFMITLSSFLFAYLSLPRLKALFARQRELDQNPIEWATPVLTVYGEALREQIETEQVLVLERRLPAIRESARARRELSPADSGPRSSCGDSAHARR
jgi:hypothetical protein